MIVSIVTVVPHEAVNRMRAAGFVGDGRSNGFTLTMSRRFPDEDAARQYGYKLRSIYSIERDGKL